MGDFVNPGCVKVFEGMKLKAVLGNNDGEVFRMGEKLEGATDKDNYSPH